ncbi:helix-turn-helix transcriptional regulator [Pseudahrensia aquimaris]|uniref:Helix-turn-helix transcriptional regulator n=1 Tax=Pseudahrensia aquimaris TaxID=744461 RepID=A0ABW3FAN8_9HYPH
MRRADRLLQIIQLLRRARGPITSAQMAAELEVSQRTLYRDIVSLESTGVPIRGEAGIGYVLEDGFDMPPLMFTTAELEALVLGARMVDGRVDSQLSRAAKDAIAKIEAVVPPGLREVLLDTPLYAPLFAPRDEERDALVQTIRTALRQERKLALHYRDLKGDKSQRIVWPILISLFADVTVFAGWCEMREDFRTFRLDGVVACDVLDAKLPERRRRLYARWRSTQAASYREGSLAKARGAQVFGI